MDLRSRRMDTEWQLLQDLAETNRSTFADVNRLQDEFRIVMQESPAWIGGESERRIEIEHALRYVYPRYYPSLPLESYFVRPIVHVNVDPVTGFICLWQDYRPAQTIVDAILITRAIMACKVANWDPAHRMQQDVIPEHQESYVLPMPPLTIPASCRSLLPHRSTSGKRRLSSAFDDQISRESNFAFSNTE